MEGSDVNLISCSISMCAWGDLGIQETAIGIFGLCSDILTRDIPECKAGIQLTRP
jgi:hypothetical protein